MSKTKQTAEDFLYAGGGMGWHILKNIVSGIDNIQDWDKNNLLNFCKEWANVNTTLCYADDDFGEKQSHSITFSNVAMALRCAISYNTISPPLFEVMEILGKEESVKRINRVVYFLWVKNNV